MCHEITLIANEDWSSPPTPEGMNIFLPAIDQVRHNHVFLLDGDRGSGKSTLLVTLIDAWTRVLRRQSLSYGGWGVPNLVPLLLDLHPLPPSTHLLLYLLGRFHRVIEGMEGRGRDGGDIPAAPWHPEASAELDSRKRWKKFVGAVGLGWDGNLQQRRGHIDPETYVVELEQAELDRLDIRDCFPGFMDALCKEMMRWAGLPKAPVFLIAVDDADMNPRRSMELLDLVRLLWHQRLVFLLTGDSDLFLIALRAHLLGELRHPLRQVPLLGHEDPGTGDIRESVRLASEILEKVIPPQNRIRLPPLGPGERLTHPLDPSAKGSSVIQELLAKIEVG